MCGIIGYVGPRASKPLLVAGPRAARVPRLRLGRARPARGRRPRLRPRRRQPPEPEAHGRRQRLRSRRPGSATPAGRRTGPSARRTPTRSPAATDHKVAIVLNGIVENYRELKESLQADGHRFSSETDAEVVVHLIERHYDGRPRRRGARRLRAARGALRLRRDPPRPPGPARRRAAPVPARGRASAKARRSSPPRSPRS